MDLVVEIQKTLIAQKRAFVLDVTFRSSTDSIVIAGPSGTGKSLTLRAIAGLIMPDAGKISLGNRLLFDAGEKINLPARQRKIGYLFQDYALFPHLSVYDNIGFGLKKKWPHHFSRTQQEHLVATLELFGLTPLRDSYPPDLSGGQRQRVALARALICKPDLLLLDEPFAALDPTLRQQLRVSLLAWQAHYQIPMIIISHDAEDINFFAQTLVLYETGAIREVLASRSAIAKAAAGGNLMPQPA